MNSLNLKDDDLDDDIFFIKQVKPINKLSLKNALLIKHNILSSLKEENFDSVSKEKVNKETIRVRKSTEKKEKTKLTESTKTSLSPNNSNGLSCTLSSSSTLSRKFKSVSPQLKNSSLDLLKLGKITPEKESFFKDMQISPGIAHKRKKFSIPDYFSPEKSLTVTKKNSQKTFKEKTALNESINFDSLKNDNDSLQFEDVNFLSFDEDLEQKKKKYKSENISYTEIKNNSTMTNEVNFTDNGDLLCFLLKKMISDVTKQQLDLESKEKNGKIFEKLLLENECNMLKNFFKLDNNLCKLFVRLLCRKNEWHRVSNLNFKDINIDLSDALQKLHEKHFVDNNIENKDLKFQLNFLKKSEIKKLCQLLNIPCKPSSRKVELINLIVKTGKNQKSIAQWFGNIRNNSLHSLIEKEVKKILGLCIKINETARLTFNKILVLFSFPHFYGEEETRCRDQLYLCMNVYKGLTKFVNYKVHPTVVFYKVIDFEEYCKALMIREAFELAIISKKYSEFFSISENVELHFMNLLNNEKYCEYIKNLESFLKRFSAGYIYGKILTKFCETFKKQNDNEKIIKITKMLLNQKIFLLSKRGKWYEILSQTLENLKDNKSAAEVLIEALKDPCIDEIQKLALQIRAQSILKKKDIRNINGYLKDMLKEISITSVQNPLTIEIRGRCMQENKSGFKSVYIQETNKGKMFTSVEELALSYYKTIGFTKGHHTEGYIIHCLYALIFFDIIYGPSPLGAFQSAYQESPLDFYSQSFYLNRKSAIDLRLKEMCNWTDEEVELRIRKVYCENFNNISIIIWKENFTPELFCEVLKCISLPLFAQICRRLVVNVKVTGFPDLTLWNPKTLKCKFVEVKGPNDKLSSAQRVWLDFLRKIGIDCEVCNVKNTGRKFSL